jgi:hypothetical protein
MTHGPGQGGVAPWQAEGRRFGAARRPPPMPGLGTAGKLLAWATHLARTPVSTEWNCPGGLHHRKRMRLPVRPRPARFCGLSKNHLALLARRNIRSDHGTTACAAPGRDRTPSASQVALRVAGLCRYCEFTRAEERSTTAYSPPSEPAAASPCGHRPAQRPGRPGWWPNGMIALPRAGEYCFATKALPVTSHARAARSLWAAGIIRADPPAWMVAVVADHHHELTGRRWFPGSGPRTRTRNRRVSAGVPTASW